MYSTCLFCHHTLDTNEVVEACPVGRRLAFDSDRGRLWVVCQRCERWNLTPLEERWEAVETCERLFRRARLRASTDHIGLARVTERLHLVRIGSPLRPEFAAWRYGDQFGRRRRRVFVHTGLAFASLGGLLAGGAALGFPVAGFSWAIYDTAKSIIRPDPDDIVAVVPREGLDSIRVRRAVLTGVRLAWEPERNHWALEVPSAHGYPALLRGEEAIGAAALLLPAINRLGASDRTTAEAVNLLERYGRPDELFQAFACEWNPTPSGRRGPAAGRRESATRDARGFPSRLAPAQRLALEMAAHEDAERRAMNGDLAALKRAWEAAEEIAAIADDLLLPAGVRTFLDRHRPNPAHHAVAEALAPGRRARGREGVG
ncbi:MAG: hypothetical protein NVS1B4_17180 [Gemmatimonadaceae bacterium]